MKNDHVHISRTWPHCKLIRIFSPFAYLLEIYRRQLTKPNSILNPLTSNQIFHTHPRRRPILTHQANSGYSSTSRTSAHHPISSTHPSSTTRHPLITSTNRKSHPPIPLTTSAPRLPCSICTKPRPKTQDTIRQTITWPRPSRHSQLQSPTDQEVKYTR